MPEKEKLLKMKLTKMEKAWILYDVGNSAFILLVSTLFPIYFDAIAQQDGVSAVDYLAYWGYAASAVTMIVALFGPVLGTMTDFKGYKKPVFLSSMLLGTAGCMLLGWIRYWLVFLVVFVIAKCGFSASLIFYDAMLGDVTTPERMDEVSARGFAWGGVYWQLYPVCGWPGAGAGRAASWDWAAAGYDGCILHCGGLVVCGDDTAVEILSAAALCTVTAACGLQQFQKACRHFEKYAQAPAGLLVFAGVFLLY